MCTPAFSLQLSRAETSERSVSSTRRSDPSVVVPVGRQQPTLTIARKAHARLVECLTIPQLARHFTVPLVEGLAIVCVQARTYLCAESSAHLAKPVRVGERLAREPDDVATTVTQRCLCLLEAVD